MVPKPGTKDVAESAQFFTDYDFPTFWEKFIVLSGIQKWDDDEKKMAHFPLFLEGNAFLMCWKLSTEDKKRCD